MIFDTIPLYFLVKCLIKATRIWMNIMPRNIIKVTNMFSTVDQWFKSRSKYLESFISQ